MASTARDTEATLRVYPANLTGGLGSLDQGSYVLMRQHEFPDTYARVDKHVIADHDHLMSQAFESSTEIIKRYTGTGDMRLGYWVKEARAEDVLACLKELLQADRTVRWTGFRVMGTVHRGNGSVVWTLELFAKGPDSKTVVYTGPDAPNVRRGKDSRRNRNSF